jgi:transposase
VTSYGEKVSEFVPEYRRDEKRTCRRKPGGGRKPTDPRRVLEGIFSVLRTGIQWKALPKEYGVDGSIHQYFSERTQAGFFRRMRQEGLIAYNIYRNRVGMAKRGRKHGESAVGQGTRGKKPH